MRSLHFTLVLSMWFGSTNPKVVVCFLSSLSIRTHQVSFFVFLFLKGLTTHWWPFLSLKQVYVCVCVTTSAPVLTSGPPRWFISPLGLLAASRHKTEEPRLSHQGNESESKEGREGGGARLERSALPPGSPLSTAKQHCASHLLMQRTHTGRGTEPTHTHALAVTEILLAINIYFTKSYLSRMYVTQVTLPYMHIV